MKINHLAGNTYYIDSPGISVPFYKIGSNNIILIDSGLKRSIIPIIEENVLKVAAVLTTHSHTDHAGANAYLREKGAVIAMPRFEAAVLSSVPNLKAWYNLFTLREIEQLFSDIIFETDMIIEPWDTEITLFGAKFELVRTPGHTPEHISVITPDGVFYASDAIMGDEDCSRAKLPYSFSMELDFPTKEGLREISAESWLLAHGGPVTQREALKLIDRNLELYNRALSNIEAQAEFPVTMDELFAKCAVSFGLHGGKSHYSFRLAQRNLITFVEYLADTGRLSYVRDDLALRYLRTGK